MLDSPIVVDVSIEIGASPATVWPYLVDWERLDRWMLEARDFQVTSSEREGVGVTAEATISIAGIRTRDAIRVIQWDPPEVLEMEHLGWVTGFGLMRCVGLSRGTRILWTERLNPPWGLLGAIGMRGVRPVMRRVFERDLKLLKQLVESDRGAGTVQ